MEKLEQELLLKDRDLVVTEKNLKRRVYEIHNLLEISSKNMVSLKGITWIHNPNPKLREAIKNGMEI